MTKIINDLKKTFWVLFTSSLVLGMIFLVSCDDGNDEPEPELYDLSGYYTFKNATLQTAVTINIGIPINVPAGKDITNEMAGGLLAEAPCDDPAKGAVELKANNELFFACVGENNEAKAGTWSANADQTELNLNLASPPLPTPLQMKIEELVINESTDVIGGSIIQFPLTPDLMLGFLPANMTDGKTPAELELLKALFPEVTQVDVDIEFQKVNP
jgi:hypothetical protein